MSSCWFMAVLKTQMENNLPNGKLGKYCIALGSLQISELAKVLTVKC